MMLAHLREMSSPEGVGSRFERSMLRMEPNVAIPPALPDLHGMSHLRLCGGTLAGRSFFAGEIYYTKAAMNTYGEQRIRLVVEYLSLLAIQMDGLRSEQRFLKSTGHEDSALVVTDCGNIRVRLAWEDPRF
jgi:hypothetical protein